MRINVYAEELTPETELVAKRARQPDGEDRWFFGVRMFLASPDALHHSPEDDDRSAITVWVPWTRRGGHDFEAVRSLLLSMVDRVDDADVAPHVFRDGSGEDECSICGDGPETPWHAEVDA